MSEINYIERYWRDAKPEDAIKDPPMVARFGNGKDMSSVSVLCGFRKAVSGQNIWYANGGCLYTHCQVYDAPDPGEGWRLIDTANEKLQEGDEFLNKDDTWVRSLNKPLEGFGDGLTYRRCIAPSVTYVPFTWEEREQLRGQWIRFRGGREVQCTKLEPLNHLPGGIAINCYTAPELLQNATFIDTGKPVGKEVTQ